MLLETVLISYRGVAQLVAHTSGGRDAAGSSPVTPTIPRVLIGFEMFYKHSRFFIAFFSSQHTHNEHLHLALYAPKHCFQVAFQGWESLYCLS